MATEGESRKASALFWAGLVGIVLVGWYIIERQKVQTGQLQSAEISNPIGRLAAYLNDKTTSVRGSTLGQVPVLSTVDEYGGRAFSRPVSNVTSGNYSATIWSAATGGITDLTSWRPW